MKYQLTISPRVLLAKIQSKMKKKHQLCLAKHAEQLISILNLVHTAQNQTRKI